MTNKKPEKEINLEPKELNGESELMMDLSNILAECSEPIGDLDDGLTSTNLRKASQLLIKKGYSKVDKPNEK
tara:strand:+ start:538 stop:753 length:216 start_codon:yes stop_codon:yes gene_type:complete